MPSCAPSCAFLCACGVLSGVPSCAPSCALLHACVRRSAPRVRCAVCGVQCAVCGVRCACACVALHAYFVAFVAAESVSPGAPLPCPAACPANVVPQAYMAPEVLRGEVEPGRYALHLAQQAHGMHDHASDAKQAGPSLSDQAGAAKQALAATAAGTSTLRYVVWQAALSVAALATPPAVVLMKRAVLLLVPQLVLLSAVCYVLIVRLSRLHLSARAMAKCLLVSQLTPRDAR